jgi:pre-mRNA-splicing factor 38A
VVLLAGEQSREPWEMDAQLLAALSRPVHGTNPLHLVERIVRGRVLESQYWQQHCFALNAEGLVDKACELEAIGGVCSENNKPTPFLCLTLKMLQILPEPAIVLELLLNGEFKYARALAAFHLRLTGKPAEIYAMLEPLLGDYSKLRVQTRVGWDLVCMDEFVHQLLHESHACEIALPRIPARKVLESIGALEPYVSPLAALLEAQDEPAGGVSAPADPARKGSTDTPDAAGRKRSREQALGDAADGLCRAGDEDAQRSSDSIEDERTRSKKVTEEESEKKDKKEPKTKSEKKEKREKKEKKEKKSDKDKRENKAEDAKPKFFIKGLKAAPPALTAIADPVPSDTVASSIEETNQLRAKLGLKPLRGGA